MGKGLGAAVAVVSFCAVIAGAFFAGAAWQSGGAKVTQSPRYASGQPVTMTRGELVEAWTAELKKAGKAKPEGWEILTTEELRGRYLDQVHENAPHPTGRNIDPGMDRKP
ncbi:hypothetical protein G3I19_32340 [Streptomyces sp. SID10853]|nr:hypothetical protein [Streptomyces sp. SID10853]